MQRATFNVNRTLDGSADSKSLRLVLEFSSQDTAQHVKSQVVKHLVAEMRQAENAHLVRAMQNPRVSVVGRAMVLEVALETEEDQKHAFAVMGTFAARRILATRGAKVVARMKRIVDRQTALGRQLPKETDIELSRTSFWSFGKKISLMFRKSKVSSDIRRCEDAYVDLGDSPDSLAKAVVTVAQVQQRQLESVDRMLQDRSKALWKDDKVSSQGLNDLARLRVMKRQMVLNASNLVLTARSAAFRRGVGPDKTKTWEEIEKLARLAGIPMPPASQDGPVGSGLSQSALPTNAKASEGMAPGDAAIEIPEGMTLEQAMAAYQAALEAYTVAAASGDQIKAREAYDRYVSAFQIYQAMVEKLEK